MLGCVGQPVGSLQVVKESLSRMRWQRDRLLVTSSAAVTANASAGVRTHNLQPDSGNTIVHISSELIRYMLDDSDLTRSVTGVDDKAPVDVEEASSSSDPRVIGSALQHQQLRAEVLAPRSFFLL